MTPLFRPAKMQIDLGNAYREHPAWRGLFVTAFLLTLWYVWPRYDGRYKGRKR